LFQDPNWSRLHELLVEHEIVTEESRDTSGAKKTFLRNKVSLKDLMSLEREADLPGGSLGDFWRAVRRV
jgi:hypothetical protein